MSEFTKEQLAYWSQTQPFAAFALALLDQNEALLRDKIQLGEERAAEWKRAEKAEAERDEANDERDDAVDRWARRAREAEATCKELLQVQAERDRLRAQLDSILANSESLESGKLTDANAEIARLREKLRAWQEKSDRHESERDSFRLEADRLREKLREAEARGPHYLRDSRLRAEGMRAAAEIARNLRPKDACTCGNYLSFRNGVPGHLPGCLVGECIEVADEIEGRAEEIDRSNRE